MRYASKRDLLDDNERACDSLVAHLSEWHRMPLRWNEDGSHYRTEVRVLKRWSKGRGGNR